MTTNARPAAHAAPGGLPPVTRWLRARIAVRPMTRVLNPLVATLAGRRHFRMAAQIRHVGRRSGRAYVTSAGARVSGDVALIPLTFGNQSDWAKKLRAAGGRSSPVGGRDYRGTEPGVLGRRGAGPRVPAAV